MDPKYDIEVELVGHDGNAFAILGRVQKALRRHLSRDLELPPAEVKAELDEYLKQATAADYNALLATTMRWVHVV